MVLIWKKKGAIFDLIFTLFSHQGKDTKNPSPHIPLTYIYVCCSPYWLFCLPNFAKKKKKNEFYHVWFLFGVTPGVDSFCAILEQ